MYHHDEFYPESDIYTDNRRKVRDCCCEKIEGVRLRCQGNSMALFTVQNHFRKEHPECSYRYDNGEPMIFIDKIWLMDIHRGTAWKTDFTGIWKSAGKRF